MTLKIVDLDEIPKGEIVNTQDSLEEIYKVCLELQDLCEKSKGVGISAVQAGIPWNLFLVKADGYSKFDSYGKYGYFINCTYEPIGEDKINSIEGCLSLKDSEGELRFFKLKRWSKIRLIGHKLKVTNSLELSKVDIELTKTDQGLVFQHEIDHQNQILISDIGSEYFVF